MCVERRCRPSKLGSPPLRHVASLLPLLWMVGAVLLDLLENPRRVTSRRVPPVPGDAHHKAGEPSRAHQVVWLLAAVTTAAALALRSVGPGLMADDHWKLQLMMMMLLWDDGHCDDRRRHAYPSSERAALQQRSSHISLEVLLRCGPAAVAALPSRARSSVSSEAAASAMVSAVAVLPSRARNEVSSEAAAAAMVSAVADFEVELRARCWTNSVYQVGCAICQDPEPDYQLRREAVVVDVSAAGPAETRSLKR